MKYIKCVCIILLLGLIGCDYLDYNEEDFISSPKKALGDYNHTKDMLTGIYSMLPDGFNEVSGAMRSSGSDDAVEANTESNVTIFYDGSWGPMHTVDAQWSHLYGAIRDANTFIQSVDTSVIEQRRYNDDYEQIKEQIKYFRPQARFLRSYFYFLLLRRYGGGIPLIKKPLGAEQANSAKPGTKREIIDFIISECNKIVNKLPNSYANIYNQEIGRATSGAVMALKAKTLLYAASPLFNPSNDRSKWIAAAKASNAIIDSALYSLEPDYGDIVNNFTSNELIFGRRLAPSNSFEKSNFPVGYKGEPGTSPTQNLVNTYDMANGEHINAPGSGYEINHPYKSRDPRLRKTIIVNNSMWKGRKVQIWNGGMDGPPQKYATPTGYYLKKYVIENLNIEGSNESEQRHLWVYFRYGGVLLNYAEAMNEAYGPQNDPKGYGITAYEAINKIRDRAEMPDLPAGMDQAKFREELRDECRVELAFENHRFWDIRRWKIGPSTTDIVGMKITKKTDDSFNYEKELIQQRQWEEKMYFYPIPVNELYINDTLEQNPGW